VVQNGNKSGERPAPMTKLRKWEEDLGLLEKGPPIFFHSHELSRFFEHNHPQSHNLRKAVKDLDIDGILCSDNAPLMYFKDFQEEPHAHSINRLHKKFWNHELAPLLVVTSPENVRVYSNGTLPKKDGDEDRVDSIKEFKRVVENLTEIKHFIRASEVGTVFQKYKSKFKSDRVDQTMLRNLKATANKLKEEGLDNKIVHALLGRAIFACYLFDRKIITQDFLKKGIGNFSSLQELLINDPSKAKKRLYSLFSRLKKPFNGDMFNQEQLADERNQITADHIEILTRFLEGGDVPSGQLTFWPYDFSVIPIELISAIYQLFLSESKLKKPKGQKSKQQIKGAFYTPRFLAETTLDLALESEYKSGKWKQLPNKTFLDPACGSGIFLVGLFHRLAAIWEHNQGSNGTVSYDERVRALKEILTTKLRGVEKDPIACRITVFSLYLAFLDWLKPKDIQKLMDHAVEVGEATILPPLIWDPKKTKQKINGSVIINDDFFAESLALDESDISFDYVVGNPPWKNLSDKVAEDRLALAWKEKRDNDKKHPLVAGNQLAQCFVWKVADYVKGKGIICFILPAGILFRQSNLALCSQRTWLNHFTVDAILNLADFRRWLFSGIEQSEGSERSAIVAKYFNNRPAVEKHNIRYLTPRTDLKIRETEVLNIYPEDKNSLPLKSILSFLERKKVPPYWKQLYVGTIRDSEFLKRLGQFAKIGDYADHPRKKMRWVMMRGFQPERDESHKHEPDWPNHFKYLSAKTLKPGLILLDNEIFPIDRVKYSKLEANPDRRIFEKPHVVINQGFSKVVYSEQDVVFRHALQGVHGPGNDGIFLKFLAVVLDSKFAQYYVFHTSGNMGIEQNKAHLGEVSSMPFFLPDDACNSLDAMSIIREVADIFDMLKKDVVELYEDPEMGLFGPISEKKRKGKLLEKRSDLARDAREKLWPLICVYYGISEYEKILIEDTIKLWKPSNRPSLGTMKIPSLENPLDSKIYDGENACKVYLELFLRVFNGYVKKSGWKIFGNVDASRKIGIGIIHLTRSKGAEKNQEKLFDDDDDITAKALDKILKEIKTVEGGIHYHRNLRISIGDDLYIVKPLTMRFWSKTAAMNDADEIAMEILSNNNRSSDN
jgi:Eco57I restriction-modification methylase